MWAREFIQCIVCNRVDRPHMAKGKCSYCYSIEYQHDPKNVKRVSAQKHEHYVRVIGPDGAKLAREAKWFSGQRDTVLQRDKYLCQRCGESVLRKLVVHHKDENGRGSEAPNNALENLKTLCRACHAAHHSKNEMWSRHFTCCQGCGTTGRKHNAKGLCWKCYLEQHPSK